MMLDRIRIVLINTSHPGNIGSAARAMKTMGLTNLYLVAPKQFPHPKAEELASGAKDILQKACVVANLDEALADCSLILGTSARSRKLPWPLLSPREMASKIKLENDHAHTAILFGCEQFGLNNRDLQRCHFHIQIPTNPVYSSLNVASALQIIAYELRMMSDEENNNQEEEAAKLNHRFASHDEMEKFFIHLEETLIAAEFLKESAPRKLMSRLRRLFLRTRPDIIEMNIMRGMLSAFQGKMQKTSK